MKRECKCTPCQVVRTSFLLCSGTSPEISKSFNDCSTAETLRPGGGWRPPLDTGDLGGGEGSSRGLERPFSGEEKW